MYASDGLKMTNQVLMGLIKPKKLLKKRRKKLLKKSINHIELRPSYDPYNNKHCIDCHNIDANSLTFPCKECLNATITETNQSKRRPHFKSIYDKE